MHSRYSLEVPGQDTFNETHNICFSLVQFLNLKGTTDDIAPFLLRLFLSFAPLNNLQTPNLTISEDLLSRAQLFKASLA